MVIQYAWFHNMVINQDWKQVKTPTEILLISSPTEGQNGSFLGFASSSYQSPVYKFKPNSIVRLIGGRVYFDTDDIIKIPQKNTSKPRKKTGRKSKAKR